MSGTIAPSSGHSPFARASLPSSTSFNNSFPSTSLFAGSSASPYVTDHQPPVRESSFNKNPQQGEPRGQTLEEMYSAPENTLEIEVREPRTQGE